MSEKRFIKLKSEWVDINFPIIWDTCNETGLNCEQAVNVLNEQQATIRKLQDLCGKSDYENAKLRIENKMLEKEVNLLRPTNLEQYEQIQKLQKENEQLKNKLNKGL